MPPEPCLSHNINLSVVPPKIGYKIGYKVAIFESKINCDIWYLRYILRIITFSYNHKLKVLTTISANMFGLAVFNSNASVLTK
jgi:hypothetical protein